MLRITKKTLKAGKCYQAFSVRLLYFRGILNIFSHLISSFLLVTFLNHFKSLQISHKSELSFVIMTDNLNCD